ncbi:epiphycan [Ictalurus punctatus]|uniref:Epiphycan n=1 Tax=Ictalurus punctatus TaxID=7998 RepID=A0A2D0T602_ICTPU|nr:epiphycan [Ictalurus punctatus]
MSELKCRTIRESRRQRWTIMMTPCRLVLGLLVLNVVLASPPRYTRQVEPDNFDEDLEYYDDLTTDEPEIEISPVAPDEDNDPETEASLEGEEEEPKWEPEKESGHEEELPITPSLIPSGSGVPGVLLGPDTPGEEELRLRLRSGGSGDSGASGISGKIPDAREYHSGEPLGSGGSGGLGSGGSADVSSGNISSEGSVDLGSAVSGDLVLGVSGDLVSGVSDDFVSGVSSGSVSGVSGDLVSGVSSGSVSGVSGDFVSGASGDFVSGVSGDYVFGMSGDFVSGVSGDSVSGVSGDVVSRVSGDFVSGVSGDFVSGVSGDVVSRVSGDFVSGASGNLFSGDSGDFGSGPSGDLISGDPEEHISGDSGDFSSGPSGDLIPGDSDEHISGDSGDFSSGPSGDLISGDSEEHISGDSGDFGSGPSGVPSGEITLLPVGEEEIYVTVSTGPEEAFKEPVSGESGVLEPPLLPEEHVTSGPPEESEVPEEFVTIIPTLLEEEELFPTTQTLPQEGAGSTMGSGLPDPDVDDNEIEVHEGLPTCLLCTCLVGSVYCEDVKLVNVPPLSKDTTHFYARFNRITKINKSDFANMNKLKRIDLTSNAISIIEDGAFFGLPALEELVIRENSVAQLPALPVTMTLVDASHNRLGRTGIQNEAFKDMTGLLYLYLTDNGIDHIPVPLPDSLRSLHLQNNNIQMIHEDTFCKRNDLSYIRRALEDIRLDGNPVNLSRTPQAYVCLPRIPVGALI